MRSQLAAHVARHAVDARLADAVGDVDGVDLGAERGDVDDEPGLALDHGARREDAGDVVRAQPDGVHGIPERQRRLPEGHVELAVGDGEGVVDQDVDAVGLGVHAREQRLDVGVDGVVAADGDPLPSPVCYRVRRLGDGAGQALGGAAGMAAAGDVDGRARLAEGQGDALADAAAGAGDDGDMTGERQRHRVVTSASRPRRMRPTVVATCGLTITCCVATCTSRNWRCSGWAA